MPKKSKKSKSKRLTLRAKYKIIKKVKEHHKKKRKELKKSGNKPKEPKDPGIPSAWPFKEELLKEMAWKKQQILMQEKQKKEEKKRAREVGALGGEGMVLADVSTSSSSRGSSSS
jgi:nuclear GTP-binding protein